MTEIEMIEDFIFEGFDKPSENWSKLPHVFMNFLPQITSLSELKVVLYILRHTWGYQEFDNPRRITVDEFMHGRKTKDGGRIDEGTGMTEPSIRDGLKRAEKHGFITIDVNDNDKARVEKSYQLNMNQGERSLPPEGKKFTPREKKVLPRSGKETSKETSKDSPSGDGDSDSKPAKPKTERAANPMYDAILAVWKYTAGRNGAMEKMLSGKATDKAHKPYNLETPITADELCQWAAWYRRENPGLSIYESPEKIQSSITYWQEIQAKRMLKPEQVGDPQFDLDVPMEFDPFDNFFKPEVQS